MHIRGGVGISTCVLSAIAFFPDVKMLPLCNGGKKRSISATPWMCKREKVCSYLPTFPSLHILPPFSSPVVSIVPIVRVAVLTAGR